MSQESEMASAPKVRTGRFCEYCKSSGLEGCDWGADSQRWLKECTACSDHRAQNDDMDHLCVIPVRRGIPAWRKYSVWDPINYPPGSDCERCVEKGLTTCDADLVLGIGCSSCLGTEAGVRKDGCRAVMQDGAAAAEDEEDRRENRWPASKMELRPRPILHHGLVPWFRRRCDTCVTTNSACSWLDNRLNWTRACDACRHHGRVCVDVGVLVEAPGDVDLGRLLTWRPLRGKRSAWAGLSHHRTSWRKRCAVCTLSNSHCRVNAERPGHACRKCSQLGLACTELVGGRDGNKTAARTFPLLSLGEVGFGGFMPFSACKACVRGGRNCDQQRPCDSCVARGDDCDEPAGKTRANMKNCFRGRLDPPPGPLYYLALGYGPGGVDDAKLGRRTEEWIGPPAPMYGRVREKHLSVIVSVARRVRQALRPRNDPPPHAARGGAMVGVPTADLTVATLRALLRKSWPGIYEPYRDASYYHVLRECQEQLGCELAALDNMAPKSSSRDGVSFVDLTRVEDDMGKTNTVSIDRVKEAERPRPQPQPLISNEEVGFQLLMEFNNAHTPTHAHAHDHGPQDKTHSADSADDSAP